METHTLKWCQDFQPFVARLQLHIIQTEDLLQCVDPYIICIYDHSEAFVERELQVGRRDFNAMRTTTQGRREVLVTRTTAQHWHEDIEEQSTFWGYSDNYEWNAF